MEECLMREDPNIRLFLGLPLITAPLIKGAFNGLPVALALAAARADWRAKADRDLHGRPIVTHRLARPVGIVGVATAEDAGAYALFAKQGRDIVAEAVAGHEIGDGPGVPFRAQPLDLVGNKAGRTACLAGAGRDPQCLNPRAHVWARRKRSSAVSTAC